jgi:CBS domain containing-hemolysin-like protein
MGTDFILGVIFLVLALFGVVLKKTYYALPEHELKRRAEHRDNDAKSLYRVVTYGFSLRVLLWLYIGFTAAASFIYLAKVMPVWLSLLIIAPLIYVTFSLIPNTKVSKGGLILTRIATPILYWLLTYLHPVLSRITLGLDRHYPLEKHTGIYERHDILELLERQSHQADSRLNPEELEIIRRAITFDEKKVSDVLIPRKQVKTLLADDTVGPVLINELHEDRQKYVLVKESKKGPVVGTLAFNELGLKSHGQVKDVMDGKLFYLHESDSLSEALHAFFVTNHSMFVVINSFEEYVGIITIESILKELLGHIPGDDFDSYTNKVSVSKRHANKKDIKSEEEFVVTSIDGEPVKTDEEVVE